MCQKILIYISVIVKESKNKKELKEVMSMSIANPLETLQSTLTTFLKFKNSLTQVQWLHLALLLPLLSSKKCFKYACGLSKEIVL